MQFSEKSRIFVSVKSMREDLWKKSVNSSVMPVTILFA